MTNKVHFGKEATKGLKKGIDIGYEAVSKTMGASGKNAVYRSYYSQNPIATNDGVSIIRTINLENGLESIGLDFLKQSAQRTNDEAGDGTSTSVVLAKHMIDKGLEIVNGSFFKPGYNSMTLRKEMLDASKNIVAQIKAKALPIETDEELFNIANLSMENPEIAQIIVDSVKKVGENGTVLVEESSSTSITREDIDGNKFEKGFISPYMINNPANMSAELADCHVLVTDKSFVANTDVFPLLEALHKQEVKQLFVICENMQGEILASIIRNRMEGKFQCVAVQKPNDDEALEDIAIQTGAELLTASKLTGCLTPNHLNSLGKAKKIVVTKDSTLIMGGNGDETKIADRIEGIKGLIKEADGYKKEMLRERLAKLVGGVVILKIGAPTEADMKYLKLKVDDAVASTQAAMEEGIVVGGGKTLYDIANVKPKNKGEEVIFFACKQLIKIIIENAGYNAGKIIPNLEVGQVWNALTHEVTDYPFEDGIIDPAKVTRCAIENSTSLAATVITTHTVIVEGKDTDNK
jgi:chaperonin GroEL